MSARTRARRGRRLVLLGVAAAVAAGTFAGAYAGDVFERQELNTVDLRFNIRGEQPRPSDIVVIGIDDVTFNELHKRWPFPRSLHAQAIRRAKAAGARAIAYDVQFTEPTTPAEDGALFDAVRAAGNVVLATTEVGPGGSTNILGGDSALRVARAVAANGNYAPDAGGSIRRFRYSTDGLAGMAVRTAQVSAGKRVDPGLFSGKGAWIDYRGPARRVPTYSFSRLVRGLVPSAALHGKVVVIGAAAPSLQDVHDTPTTRAMSGPEIQANAISTVLRGLPLRSSPALLDVLAIILLGALGPATAIRVRLRGIALTLGLAFGAYAVLAQLAFDGGTVISVLYPLGSLVTGGIGALTVNYITEARERQRTRAAFRRFVPAPVVDTVLEQADEDLRLGGVEMHGTVMFCDLRGFTTFSEANSPKVAIDVLNGYLTEMTAAIHRHGGTVLSYLGDGILAVFGAPLVQSDHADRALEAAREMVDVCLPRFNEWRSERGKGHDFRMGIGLNSGPFMAGNVGSDERLEYTVIGDTVNTASRIEGLTKGSSHSIYASGATRAALTRNAQRLVFHDETEVRGRRAPIELWTIAPDDEPESPSPDAAAAATSQPAP